MVCVTDIGVPRVIETSSHILDAPEFVDAAKELDAKITCYEVCMLKEKLDLKNDDIKEVNSYRHTLNYLKENRINMNFRQVNF